MLWQSAMMFLPHYKKERKERKKGKREGKLHFEDALDSRHRVETHYYVQRPRSSLVLARQLCSMHYSSRLEDKEMEINNMWKTPYFWVWFSARVIMLKEEISKPLHFLWQSLTWFRLFKCAKCSRIAGWKTSRQVTAGPPEPRALVMLCPSCQRHASLVSVPDA